MVQEYARVACRVEGKILGRQGHSWYKALHRRWPGQMGVRFDQPRHEKGALAIDNARILARQRCTGTSHFGDAVAAYQNLAGKLPGAAAVENLHIRK